MDVAQLTRIVCCTGSLEPDELDVDDTRRALADVGLVARWADQLRIRLLAHLSVLADDAPTIFPERINAEVSLRSAREADRDMQRAATVQASPSIGDAFEGGSVSVHHLDVPSAARRLEPEQRRYLLEDGTFAQMAVGETPEEFERSLRSHVRRMLTDDGITRFEQQRRAVRFRSWVERDSGMLRVTGALDPESGARFVNRIQDRLDTLFHDASPDTCPGDPVARQDHVRGLALVALTEAKHGHPGVTEVVVTIDVDTLEVGPHPGSEIDLGIELLELPLATIRGQCCLADVIPIVRLDGVTIDVGRTQGLATKTQRRALRAMYRTCAVPGCTVPFDRCEPHHIAFWRHGGATDLGNLLPLCSRHHHCAHEGGRRLALDPDTRHLVVTLPDGSSIHGEVDRPASSTPAARTRRGSPPELETRPPQQAPPTSRAG